MSKTDTAKPEADELHASTPLTLLQRLHAVMSEVAYVQKDHTIDMGKRGYKVVTHDAVTAKVRPALVRHGVFYYPHKLGWAQNGQRTEVDMVIRFVSVDNKDDYLDVPTLGFGLDTGDKGPGKAMSYAVKYALLKALGLETGEDADNEASPEAEPHGEKAPRGPRGGRAKVESDKDTLVLKVGKDAYSYPFSDWENVGRFIEDLYVSVDEHPDVYDVNRNDIDRVRDKITMAGHTKLLDRLQDVDLLLEQKFLQAG